MKIIRFENVWEMYRIKFIIDGKISWDNLWALKDLTFDVERGEILGIIGENGAGKSTILKLIMGMLQPDRGSVQISGKVSGLLELGAGFRIELTGRENVYLSGKLFGLSREQIEKRYKDIVDFASLGKFIHAQVKCYSQGMFVRLAFAIAIHMDPEILLIDDTLAVGDEYFQRRCIKKIFELKDRGKTMIIVSHDMNMLRQLCKRVIFLKEGRLVKDGTIGEVVPLYSQMVEVNRPPFLSSLDRLTFSFDKLKLTFDNGQLILGYDGINLTKANHICSTIYANEAWYYSNMGHWEVHKENENRIIARISWPKLPLIQTWKIERCEKSSLLWSVDIEVKEKVDIQEQYLEFECSSYYKFYFSDYGAGSFPDSFLDREIDVPQRCIPDGVLGVQSQDATIPAIYLKLSNSSNDFAKIFNSDFQRRARILRINRIESEDNVHFQPGSHQCIKIKLTVDKDKKVPIKSSKELLEQSKLRFIFDSGRGRIFWDKRELTKQLGLYTSLRSADRWYDSKTQAMWSIEDKSRDTLRVLGRWFYLPVGQFWHIRLKEGCIIEFSVDIKVDDKVEVDRLQTNIMLSEKYKGWFSDTKNGLFSDFKGDIDDDWEVLWSSDGGAKNGKGYVGVSKNSDRTTHLPIVKFMPLLENSGFNMNIINSDLYHRGRILQYLKKDKIILMPGEYLYYKGRIVLEGV